MVPASAAALLLAREQAIANAPQSVFEAVETASGVLQGMTYLGRGEVNKGVADSEQQA